MPRYVAFLRGVSPLNAKMPELKRAFELAGFTDVKTLLSSGNVVFASSMRSAAAIEREAEAAMTEHLGRSFYTVVRPVDALRRMVEADPFTKFTIPPGTKRVVTFLREPRKLTQPLPIELDGACIHALQGAEIFTTYLRTPHGPVFMALLEKTFGASITSRTWETVTKCANAQEDSAGPKQL
jgi:uncharacterized protein (DUF1697 family)